MVLVAAAGLWGCAQGPSGHAQAERVKGLEAKCAKLEEDYRAVAAARDQIRKKTADLEAEVAQLRAVVKERDELRHQVTARTGERDLLQQRCDRLKKGIQELLGQDEALLAPAGGPAAPAAAPAATLSVTAEPGANKS